MQHAASRLARILLTLLALAGPATALAQGIAQAREPGSASAVEPLAVAKTAHEHVAAAALAIRARADQRGLRATTARRSAHRAVLLPVSLLASSTSSARTVRARHARRDVTTARPASAVAPARQPRAPPAG